MELRQALLEITEIREQMARSSVFRGYRAVPVALTGVIAILGGIAQGIWIPDAPSRAGAWLALWIGVAAVCALVPGVEMLVRYRRSASELAKARTRLAVLQFAPSIVAAAAMTCVLARAAPGALWTLPGLWSIFFALGIFASRPVLPRALLSVAAYYLLAGLAVLLTARGGAAFSPPAMAVPFGGGQLLAAFLLYWTLERNHAGV